jgi:hypothetical protein
MAGCSSNEGATDTRERSTRTPANENTETTTESSTTDKNQGLQTESELFEATAGYAFKEIAWHANNEKSDKQEYKELYDNIVGKLNKWIDSPRNLDAEGVNELQSLQKSHRETMLNFLTHYKLYGKYRGRDKRLPRKSDRSDEWDSYLKEWVDKTGAGEYPMPEEYYNDLKQFADYDDAGNTKSTLSDYKSDLVVIEWGKNKYVNYDPFPENPARPGDSISVTVPRVLFLLGLDDLTDSVVAIYSENNDLLMNHNMDFSRQETRSRVDRWKTITGLTGDALWTREDRGHISAIFKYSSADQAIKEYTEMRESNNYNEQVKFKGQIVDQIAIKNPDGEVEYTIAKQSGRYIALTTEGNTPWGDWGDDAGETFWSNPYVTY